MGKSLKIDNENLEKTRLHFRENMPVTKKWAYFDHAAVAPLPASSRQAILHWLDQATEEGDTCWPHWNRQLEKLRRCGADLLHASQDEIALIPNTSSGISFVAEGLPWKAGDNLVIPNNEFPSNALPWKHLEDRGVEVRQVPIVDASGDFDLSPMARAIDGRTRLISASWIGFSNGLRIPLDDVCELATSKKVLFFLDAIQGLGVFPLDLSKYPIDFVAADGHKWMLGPEGAGMLFVRQKLLDQIRPSVVGWGSVEESWKFSPDCWSWKKNASKFEAGSANMVGMIGFQASLEFLLSLGCHQPDNPVEKLILDNVAQFEQALRSLGARFKLASKSSMRSGIVSFEFPGADPDSVRKQLMDAGIVTSVRQGKLRISTHAYNNEDDFGRLIDTLKDSIHV